MQEIIDFIVSVVGDLGYAGIFVMMVLESSFFPFPSEIAMIPAGYLASVGEMNFLLALIIGTIGALLGASINYFLGRKLGGPIIKSLIKKFGKYLFLKESHYDKSETYFKKHGAITTFLARFIPAVRQLISLPAGVFKMNLGKFLFYSGLGAGLWNLILMIIGYIAGENRELISRYSKEALILVIIFGVLVGVIYYFINKNKKRTIFIGDIHGCFDEFMLLLKKLKIRKNDTIYLLGDLINKGPKSYEVLDFAYKNKDKYISIIGNHELSFLNFLGGKNTSNEEYTECFLELQEKIGNKNYLINFIKNLPLYIEKEKFITLHGGIIPGKKLEEHTAEEMTNLRYYEEKPWYKYYKGDKKIIYGHWALKGLKIKKSTIGIDTGCVYGNELSAYVLETGEIIQQKAIRQYVF